ncbi:anti-sigma factor [Rugamonas sp.]|uniref:anti-sigma factor family protein n=1 Tax=Rugamonas sp. TaxID=1926287 RepID=UPI0025EF91A7|nr:anti-sigma factor [Rugamonas sp.]
MDCNQAQDLMSAYVDGELDAATALQMERHLAGCAACEAALAQQLELRATIAQQATRHKAPPHLKHRIRAALAQQQPRRRAPRTWPWAWINLGIAGASTAAFAVTLALYLGQPSGGERLEQDLVASHFRSLMPDHLADVASTDQHTVKPWFAGKLDFSPPVVDLAQQDFPLVGGRLDYLNQRAVAALVYRHRKHIINLYLWPQRSAHEAPASAPQSSSHQGFQLLRWSDKGMDYSAVSDLNGQELAQFAHLLQAKIDEYPPQ